MQGRGGLPTQRPVQTVVVVGHVVGQNALEMVATEDQDPVETLPTDSANETVDESFGPWCSDWGADDPDAFSLEDLVETRGELGISVTDQEPDGKCSVGQHHAEIAGLLEHHAPDGLAVTPVI
jgi:hypothetical protein